jgi:FlaA1/EpsC-like NDP-sugar epimerase
VDWCETNHAEVIRVNVCGTLALADECAKRGSKNSIM